MTKRKKIVDHPVMPMVMGPENHLMMMEAIKRLRWARRRRSNL